MLHVFKVYMTAFGNPGEVREVTLTDEEYQTKIDSEDLLDLIYRNGQNDFQPLPHASVSKGDVIELPIPETNTAQLYIVQNVGFKKISISEFVEYLNVPQRDRHFHYLTDGTL